MTAPITDHDWWFAAGIPVASLVVEVPTALVLNLNQRLHRMEQARRTSAIRQLAFIAARNQPRPSMTRAHCRVDVGWPDRRERDAHNYYGTIKAAIDGIVQDAKWLPDDSDVYLVGPDLRSFHRGRKGLIVLHFSFLDLSGEAA